MAEKKQRKPTSTDVAELAGVSQTSVSLVLSGSSRATFSEQTRARVFEAARQLGYQPPAHRTRKKNGNDRRLILVLTPTLANQYYSELIQTLEDYAGSQEFRVLVCNTFRKRELEKYYLEQFSDNRISGIVYTFLPSFPDEAVRLSARIPLVLIGEKREELPICSIELSNQRAGAMLADHLYSLGHRHAAFISTPMDQTTLARKQRLEGLEEDRTASKPRSRRLSRRTAGRRTVWAAACRLSTRRAHGWHGSCWHGSTARRSLSGRTI